MEKIPNRTSDGGPESQKLDWCDWLYVADEHLKAARLMQGAGWRSNRLAAINQAIEACERAKELLK